MLLKNYNDSRSINMANHYYYHFKNKITIEEVEQHIKTFCRERLGNEALASRDGDYVEVTIPVADTLYPMSASFFSCKS